MRCDDTTVQTPSWWKLEGGSTCSYILNEVMETDLRGECILDTAHCLSQQPLDYGSHISLHQKHFQIA
jgi:hypothetical protein